MHGFSHTWPNVAISNYTLWFYVQALAFDDVRSHYLFIPLKIWIQHDFCANIFRENFYIPKIVSLPTQYWHDIYINLSEEKKKMIFNAFDCVHKPFFEMWAHFFAVIFFINLANPLNAKCSLRANEIDKYYKNSGKNLYLWVIKSIIFSSLSGGFVLIYVIYVARTHVICAWPRDRVRNWNTERNIDMAIN